MTYRTVEGTLHPNGTIALPAELVPDHPVRVMVTLLENEDVSLAEPGDYHECLSEYEERLARGEIQWQ